MISQPVILSPTTKMSNDSAGKWEQFFNTHGFWQGSAVVAAEVSFVEQQAAMVDSKFFVSLRKGWQKLSRIQHKEGSDFGTDSSWCGAAGLFAPKRVACAIVPVAIEHDNTRTLNWTEDPTFWERSMRVTKLARTSIVPEWWATSVKLMGEFRRRETGGERDVQRARKGALESCLDWLAASGTTASCADSGQAVNRSRARPRSMMRTLGRVPCGAVTMPCFPKCHTHFSEIAWCKPRSDQRDAAHESAHKASRSGGHKPRKAAKKGGADDKAQGRRTETSKEKRVRKGKGRGRVNRENV